MRPSDQTISHDPGLMGYMVSRRTFIGGLGVAGAMLASPLVEACSSTGQRSSTHPALTSQPPTRQTPSPVQVQVGTPSETQIDGRAIKFSLLTPDQFTKLTSQQLARLAASRQPIGIEFNPRYSIDSVRQSPQPFVYTDDEGHNLSAAFGIAALHTGEKIMLVIPISSGNSGESNAAADIAAYSIDPSGTKFIAVGFLQPALPDARYYVELFDHSQPLEKNRISYRDVNPNTIMFVVEAAHQVDR